MKKIHPFILIAFTGFAASAQTTRPSLVRAEAVKTLTVASEATIVSYEKVISPGRLSFAKSFRPSETGGNSFTTTYTLTISGDQSFNNRKPVKIGLSRKSFDSVFTRGSSEMAAKYPALNKYVTDRNISLNSEEGWIAVVKYFNVL